MTGKKKGYEHIIEGKEYYPYGMRSTKHEAELLAEHIRRPGVSVRVVHVNKVDSPVGQSGTIKKKMWGVYYRGTK
jgi:hypothetical protein